MLGLNEIVAITTIVASSVAILAYVLGKVKAARDEDLSEALVRNQQGRRIDLLENRIQEEIDKVVALEGKLEELKESLHLKDVKLSELVAIIDMLKESQVSIESDIKELILLVGRGS